MRTGNEVKDLFNLKYNNINSGVSPGLNDYEISLYLTEAQRQIVDDYYKGTPNNNESFEDIERIRKAISILVKHNTFTVSLSSTPSTLLYYCYNIEPNNNIWRVIWEYAILLDEDNCLNGKRVKSIPVKHDEFDYTIDNPHKSPSNNRVIRLDLNNTHEIVSKYRMSGYTCRYLEHPKPFVISDLTVMEDEIGYIPTVENVSTESLCVFDNFVENVIIDRAVELATKDYKENTLQTQLPMNQRVE